MQAVRGRLVPCELEPRKAGSGALMASRTAAWGRATVFFSAFSRFLGAVKNGSGLSSAVAKQDALYLPYCRPEAS